MCVGTSEQKRTKYHCEKTSNIALENPVDEKSKNELLNDRRDRDRENNDHDPLLDRARSTEELDDTLFA